MLYRIRPRRRPPIKNHQFKRLQQRLARLGGIPDGDEWVCELTGAQLAKLERLYANPAAGRMVVFIELV